MCSIVCSIAIITRINIPTYLHINVSTYLHIISASLSTGWLYHLFTIFLQGHTFTRLLGIHSYISTYQRIYISTYHHGIAIIYAALTVVIIIFSIIIVQPSLCIWEILARGRSCMRDTIRVVWLLCFEGCIAVALQSSSKSAANVWSCTMARFTAIMCSGVWYGSRRLSPCCARPRAVASIGIGLI